MRPGCVGCRRSPPKSSWCVNSKNSGIGSPWNPLHKEAICTTTPQLFTAAKSNGDLSLADSPSPEKTLRPPCHAEERSISSPQRVSPDDRARVCVDSYCQDRTLRSVRLEATPTRE